MIGLNCETELLRYLTQPGNVGRVAEVAGEPLDGGPRRTRQVRRFLDAGPFLQHIAALIDPYAVAEVIAEDDVEARHHHPPEEVVDAAEAVSVGQRENETVVDVAVEEKLIGGLTFVEGHQPLGPLRKRRRHQCCSNSYFWSSAAMAPPASP